MLLFHAASQTSDAETLMGPDAMSVPEITLMLTSAASQTFAHKEEHV